MDENPKLEQLNPSEWKLICETVWLCSLPFCDKDISAATGIQFNEYLEDGLGRVRNAICKLNGRQLLLQTCIDGLDEVKRINVHVHGHETEWERIKLELCVVLGIEISELPLVQNELQPGRWRLTRLDDNGNNVEMYRFPMRCLAEQAQKEFTHIRTQAAGNDHLKRLLCDQAQIAINTGAEVTVNNSPVSNSIEKVNWCSSVVLSSSVFDSLTEGSNR